MMENNMGSKAPQPEPKPGHFSANGPEERQSPATEASSASRQANVLTGSATQEMI
jgi:hypothetical protein